MAREPSAAAMARRVSGSRPVLAALLPAVVIAISAGMWSGLARLGVDVPAVRVFLEVNHGALMVSGVVGTVIGLERSVAMRRLPAYAAPLLSAAGAAVLVVDLPEAIASGLFVASAAALTALFLAFLRRQVALPLAVMTAGAACWFAGNVAWLLGGWSPPAVVPWWMAFLALTIAGERLELTRFMPLSLAVRGMLAAAVALLLVAPLLDLAGAQAAGIRLVGLATLLLSLWLVVHDTARRTVRRGGVAAYAGAALLAAYVWLGVAGAALVAWALEPGLRYDTTLHAFFLGFVFGSIFAHAPIILPAITGLPLRFTALFPAGLALLHGSLALRVLANLFEAATARQLGGVLNVVAVLVLGAAIVAGLALGERRGLGAGARVSDGSSARF